MKKIVLLLSVFFVFNIGWAQEEEEEDSSAVHWMTFEEVNQLFYKKQKPILIWVYSQNCDSCWMMQYETFNNTEVADYINKLFYPIKFDIQSNDTIKFFNNMQFTHLPGKEYHQLAYLLLGKQIKVPALVMFNKYAKGSVFYGYKDRDHIFPLLVYYNEEVYLSTPYEQFEKLYFKTYPPGVPQVISRLFVHWQDIADVDSLMKKQPKKILIDVYNRYSVSQTIMRLQTYNNPLIASYLNKHFYVVNLEANDARTFYFNGEKYRKSLRYPYNELAISLLGGNMKFPAFVILDENYKLLTKEQVFLPPEKFYPIAKYFGDDAYKTEKFEEFLKSHKSELDSINVKLQKYYK